MSPGPSGQPRPRSRWGPASNGHTGVQQRAGRKALPTTVGERPPGCLPFPPHKPARGTALPSTVGERQRAPQLGLRARSVFFFMFKVCGIGCFTARISKQEEHKREQNNKHELQCIYIYTYLCCLNKGFRIAMHTIGGYRQTGKRRKNLSGS